jgi:hypothetical protein
MSLSRGANLGKIKGGIFMTLTFNLQGAERKPLVAAISEILETKAEYLRTPTYAFQVGGYHIDRNGTVTGEDNFDLATALRNRGFTAASYAYDNTEDPADDFPRTEREELGLGRERREDYQGENGMSADDVEIAHDNEAETGENEASAIDTDETPTEAEEPQETATDEAETPLETATSPTATQDGDGFIIEMPITGFDPAKLDNLCKMVTAKETLIKAALGVEAIPIQVIENAIRFPWFNRILTHDEVEAYSTFISLLCKTAIEKKRITAKEKTTEGSPKYAMRCFLLSIGFIGGQYKASRKILLSKLEGNGSWKTGNGKRAAPETAPEAETAEVMPTGGEFDSEMNSEAELLADAALIHAVNESSNDEE